jgi:hypothetical protein
VKDEHCAKTPAIVAGNGGGIDLQPAFLRSWQLHFVRQHTPFKAHAIHQFRDLVRTNGFQEHFAAKVARCVEKFRKRAIGHLHAAIAVEHKHAFGHAVEQHILLGADFGGNDLLLSSKLLDFNAPCFTLAPQFASPPQMQHDQTRNGKNGKRRPHGGFRIR